MTSLWIGRNRREQYPLLVTGLVATGYASVSLALVETGPSDKFPAPDRNEVQAPLEEARK